jgi:hypothetical protein
MESAEGVCDVHAHHRLTLTTLPLALRVGGGNVIDDLPHRVSTSALLALSVSHDAMRNTSCTARREHVRQLASIAQFRRALVHLIKCVRNRQ